MILLLLFLHAGVKCVGVRSRSQPYRVPCYFFIVYRTQRTARGQRRGAKKEARTRGAEYDKNGGIWRDLNLKSHISRYLLLACFMM